MKRKLEFDEVIDRILHILVLISIVLVMAVLIVATVKLSTSAAEPIEISMDEAVSNTDAEVIAQILYHECRSLPKLEQSAVVWVILNRVDSELAYFPDTVHEVCTQKIGTMPMFAYREDAPVEEALYLLAVDVLTRWQREKAGETDVGRTLPQEYVYFWGDGRHNYFRQEYQGKQYWDWSLPNPYEEVQP